MAKEASSSSSVKQINQVVAQVPMKSAWLSKINWTQAIGVVAMVGTALNLFDLDPEMQVKVVTAIGIVQGGITWMIKTFFTPTVTPTSVAIAKAGEGA